MHRLSISGCEAVKKLDEMAEEFEVVSPVSSIRSGGSFEMVRESGMEREEDEVMEEDEASMTPDSSLETEQQGAHEDKVMREGVEAPESGHVTDEETDVDLAGKEFDVGEARDVAARALAALPEDETSQLLTTPLYQGSQRDTSSNSLPTSAKSSPSPKFLRSPCWRSLIPVTPPPGGYWTPSSTAEGEKNTPMCGPCKTGKKGRCYGGLPCDRCKEKGYSKERCEGSVVFRFSPKSKRGRCGKEKAVKKLPVDGGRLKRDAFGRFA
jgi:hypothetical protein